MPKRSYAVIAAVLAFLFLLPALLAGCAGLPLDYPRTASSALLLPEKTDMGKRIQSVAAKHPGKSGFYLLPTGEDAFLARVLTIDQTERTLDLQYYIFEDDLTGKFLMDRLLAAAERGVRVRLLLDGWTNAGKTDWGLALVRTNPNIEVRVFNPFGGLRSVFFSRVFQALFVAPRLRARMHNKIFIADNCLAIVGGRNIGDAYFGARLRVRLWRPGYHGRRTDYQRDIRRVRRLLELSALHPRPGPGEAPARRRGDGGVPPLPGRESKIHAKFGVRPKVEGYETHETGGGRLCPLCLGRWGGADR